MRILIDRDRILTETFLALLALIDHSKEEMALATKNCINANLELYIAIEDIQGCLAKYDPML